jgi:hypothetical protein
MNIEGDITCVDAKKRMGVKKGAIPLAGNVQIDIFALSVVHTYCWCGHLCEIQGVKWKCEGSV